MLKAVCRGFAASDKFEHIYYCEDSNLWAYTSDGVFLEYDAKKLRINFHGKLQQKISPTFNFTAWPDAYKEPGPGLSTVLFMPKENVLLKLPRYDVLRVGNHCCRPFEILEEFAVILKQLGY